MYHIPNRCHAQFESLTPRLCESLTIMVRLRCQCGGVRDVKLHVETMQPTTPIEVCKAGLVWWSLLEAKPSGPIKCYYFCLWLTQGIRGGIAPYAHSQEPSPIEDRTYKFTQKVQQGEESETSVKQGELLVAGTIGSASSSCILFSNGTVNQPGDEGRCSRDNIWHRLLMYPRRHLLFRGRRCNPRKKQLCSGTSDERILSGGLSDPWRPP